MRKCLSHNSIRAFVAHTVTHPPPATHSFFCFLGQSLRAALITTGRARARQGRHLLQGRRASGRQKQIGQMEVAQVPGPKRGVTTTSAKPACRTLLSSWLKSMTSKSVSSIREPDFAGGGGDSG